MRSTSRAVEDAASRCPGRAATEGGVGLIQLEPRAYARGSGGVIVNEGGAVLWLMYNDCLWWFVTHLAPDAQALMLAGFRLVEC